MKFKEAKSINGTSLQGYLLASYDQLVAAFGLPQCGPNNADADKVTCCWELEFEDGTVATIYDWKLGKTPFEPYQWHIGGFTSESVIAVKEAFSKISNLNTYRVRYSYQVEGYINVTAVSKDHAEEMALEASIGNRINEHYIDDTFVVSSIKEI